MKVILMDNIKGVGRIGEVKNISDGYGRNFLLPRNLAKIATAGSMKEVEGIRKKAEAAEKIRQGKAKELIDGMKDIVIDIARKSNDKGTLFEGVEARDISEALSKKISFDVTEDMVRLDEPIKHIGKHTVEIELAPETTTQITVEVKNAS